MNGIDKQDGASRREASFTNRMMVIGKYFLDCMLADALNFNGRAGRLEYWSFMLLYMGLTIIIARIGLLVGGFAGIALIAIYGLATWLPAWSVLVRRLHDIGLSGWFFLIGFIPYAGAMILLVMTLLPSQQRENRWGIVPLIAVR